MKDSTFLVLYLFISSTAATAVWLQEVSVPVEVDRPVVDNCSLPKDPGSCYGSFEKYYFDKGSQTCKQFIYGGCGGNGNRFDTIKECQSACRPKDIDVCSLPKVVGHCRAAIPRFYFDQLTQKCKSFTYGGCDGNANRFKTIEQCQNACPPPKVALDKCQLPAEPGVCDAYFPKYYFDNVAQECKKFVYGGCGGNDNRFDTLQLCQAACRPSKPDNCSLPKDPGSCYGSFEKYYFDKGSQTCKQFIYGGCGGNGNRFDTIKECQSACRPKDIDVCSLPKVVGNCRAAIPSFYFDQLTQKCKSFTYGGCDGNANRFKTIEQCQNACPPPKVALDKCQLPAEPGVCDAYFPKYYFDNVAQECKKFVYGGCGGNDNRFDTLQLCQAACRPSKPDNCSLPKDPGSCYGSFEKYYFDKGSQTCKQFIYGGCGGNGNRFDTIKECQSACRPKDIDVCSLPKVVGHCRAAIPRFYFDQSTQKCKSFTYGGCDGNANRFETIEQCQKACPSSPNVDICCLPMVIGPCRAAITSYYFDQTTKKCKKFSYGGCQGNANRFPTIEQCQSACPTASVDICSLPKEVGPCRAAITSYFFNQTTEQCESFTYGGCEGNANRFGTIEECESACYCYAPEIDVCSLPKVVGPCEAVIPSFYFDQSTKSCLSFDYGGCQGNANRFKTIEECQSVCRTPDVAINTCDLPKDPGPCKAKIPMFYFDQSTQSCQSFDYGGCDGNANRFQTIEECQAECPPPDVDVCSLPMVSGPCTALFQKYYYNQETGTCQEFTYGGCQGNANRFDTIDQCLARCGCQS